jgi:hypothetical protein
MKKKLIIETAGGRASFRNVQTIAGYKALYKYLKRLQAESKPFIVHFGKSPLPVLEALSERERATFISEYKSA